MKSESTGEAYKLSHAVHTLLATDQHCSAIINRTKEICTFQLEKKADRIISELQWMGILSSEMAIVKNGKTLDTLCAQLEKALTFNPGERDLVMLQRNFFVERANGEKVNNSHPLYFPFLALKVTTEDIHIYARATGRSEGPFCSVFLCPYYVWYCIAVVVG